MRAMIVIAIMAGTMFMITLSQATEMNQGDKSKQTMEQKQADQKQADKKKDRKTKRAVPGGSMGEERTGGSGPSGTSGGENVKAPQHEGFGSKKKQ